MEGIFLIQGMTVQASAEKGPNAMLKDYLKKKGVDIKNPEIKISACKGGDNRSTAISHKDILDKDIKTYYLGLTDNTETMKAGKWNVYQLDKAALKTRLFDRYNDKENLTSEPELSRLLEKDKNYRVNVGKAYVQDSKNGAKSVRI